MVYSHHISKLDSTLGGKLSADKPSVPGAMAPAQLISADLESDSRSL